MPFKRLLRAAVMRDRGSAQIPHGQRIYAIGDIHGRLDLLDDLLKRIEGDDQARGGADTMLVFLGDLVDRGPQSSQVIERLLDLRESGRNACFLLGNHDEVFLKAVEGDLKALRFLIRIGGKETVLSYGMTADVYRHADFVELSRLFSERVPDRHRTFLQTFENYLEVGDYLFVHAGIRPGLRIDQQSTADLRWIRGDFLHDRTSHGKIVIHGHSISDEADIRKNRIGIDTGAFASGKLTALGLEGYDRWFLSAQGAPDPRWQRMTD